jgi:hypothetical protein
MAGFVGWGLIGPAGVLAGQTQVAVVALFCLSAIVMFRRMQGNPGNATDLRSRLHRIVWDTDGVAAERTSVGRRALS